jgi:hypothetical protein
MSRTWKVQREKKELEMENAKIYYYSTRLTSSRQNKGVHTRYVVAMQCSVGIS